MAENVGDKFRCCDRSYWESGLAFLTTHKFVRKPTTSIPAHEFIDLPKVIYTVCMNYRFLEIAEMIS